MTRNGRIGIAAVLVVGTGVLTAGGLSATSDPVESTVPAESSFPGSSVPVGPSTTLDPVVAEQAAASAAATGANAAANRVFAAPNDPEALAELDQFYVAGSGARTAVDEEAQRLSAAGAQVSEGPDSPGSFTIEQAVLADGPPSTAAALTVCVVLSRVEYVVSSVPETSESVVSDTVAARRATYQMVKGDDGQWRLDAVTVLETFDGATSCPPPPPPTTLDPIANEEALVAQRVQEIDAISWNAYFNPDAPGTAEALDSIYTERGVARQVLDSDHEALRAKGWIVRPNPSIPQSITVEEVTLLEGPPATHADVVVCIIDSTFLIDPGGLPDGSDLIISDEVVAFRSLQHLFLEDGTWQLDEVESIDEWTGVAACPAA